MTASKILFIILDGISDRPCPDLNGLTPLSAAKTPVLDKLAAEGCCGIMDTIGPGIRPGSDTAHLALLGYDPHKYYTGRGPLECEGTGIPMEPGMIGFRCNFATLSPQGIITDRRAGRIHDTQALSKAIKEGVDLSGYRVEFSFRSGAGLFSSRVSAFETRRLDVVPHGCIAFVAGVFVHVVFVVQAHRILHGVRTG